MDWILLTNDDGIEAVSLQNLVSELHAKGFGVIVFAPKENNSAVSMKITLGKPISIEAVPDDRQNDKDEDTENASGLASSDVIQIGILVTVLVLLIALIRVRKNDDYDDKWS